MSDKTICAVRGCARAADHSTSMEILERDVVEPGSVEASLDVESAVTFPICSEHLEELNAGSVLDFDQARFFNA